MRLKLNTHRVKNLREDRTKAVLSLVATLFSVVLVIIYWQAPIRPDSHPLHVLLIDCIPDSIVVLVAIPIVYWLFYRRGLTNMGDCPLFDKETHNPGYSDFHAPSRLTMQRMNKSISSGVNHILVVNEDERGLLTLPAEANYPDQVVKSLNDTLKTAEARGMPVVFITNYNPPAQCSLDPGGRCLGFSKIQWSSGIYKPAASLIIEKDHGSQEDSFSAVNNPFLDLLVSNQGVSTVYIAGAYLENSIRDICLDLLERGKKTVAVQNAVYCKSTDHQAAESIWKELEEKGLARAEGIGVIDETI